MKISIQSLLEGARNASGAVAVIDTFRAFTTAAVALANGASRIIMVATVEEALALRAAETGAICMGVADHTTLQNEYTPRTQVSRLSKITSAVCWWSCRWPLSAQLRRSGLGAAGTAIW